VAASTAQVIVNLSAATASVSNLIFKAYATEKQSPALTQVEVPIYGSGKLGTYYPAQDGSAAYEITDHLGNVRALLRENVNIYTATMEDNGTADLTNPRVTEMNYFQNIFKTEVRDAQMNHTKPLAAVANPDKAVYLYWIGGTQGMDVQDKSVGPAIALKVSAGDKVNLETWARYEHKEDYTEDISLMMFSQLLGTSFAYIQGFDAMPVSKATETFQAALPALTGAGVDASQPRAFLNYIVFNSKMESIASDRVQVSEAAGFEPDERAVPDMFEKLAMKVTINEPGYIYAWVSNGSENTKVWFDDFSVAHTSNFVTQATDYEMWGNVLREQKTDESIYRYSYQGQYAEKDKETEWTHFELREFDPIIGRWTATDPAGQYWSPYIGMGNNPISSVDPDGAYTLAGALWRNTLYGGSGIYRSGKTEDGSRDVWGYNTEEGANFGEDTRSFWTGGDIFARVNAEAIPGESIPNYITRTRGGDAIEFDAGTQFMLGQLASSSVRGVFAFAEGYMTSGGGTFYRTMSSVEYAALQENNGLTHMAGKELFVSSSENYSRAYLQKSGYDVLVQFNMKPGAMDYFNKVGVFHRTAAGSSGWAGRGSLLWKSEQGAMNLGIQSNTHMFNPWIQSFKAIK
jgi:RHS repeat-associated protein